MECEGGRRYSVRSVNEEETVKVYSYSIYQYSHTLVVQDKE